MSKIFVALLLTVLIGGAAIYVCVRIAPEVVDAGNTQSTRIQNAFQ